MVLYRGNPEGRKLADSPLKNKELNFLGRSIGHSQGLISSCWTRNKNTTHNRFCQLRS